MAGMIRIAGYCNSDGAFVAWAPADFIPDCRGFLLECGRKTKKSEKIDVVENRVGFPKDKPKSGDHQPSNVWPFQRFNWTDHAVDVGNVVRYRVTAMIRDAAGTLVPGVASDWTPWLTLTPDAGDGFLCYFNRGLVISQFVARYMRDKKLSSGQLKSNLKTLTDPKFRAFLQGDLGARLLALLAEPTTAKDALHAALYELDDDILESVMIALGSKLKLILANGSDKAGDENADARKNLVDNGVVPIARLLKSKGLGHNKFVVRSDKGGPNAVWTGSTNWSTTGLCTQINNALLIEDASIANLYQAQWDRPRDALPPMLDPANFPPALVASNDMSHDLTIGSAKVTVWFTRTSDGRDMDALRALIAGAKQSIHFLMFMPGPDGLHTLAAARPRVRTRWS